MKWETRPTGSRGLKHIRRDEIRRVEGKVWMSEVHRGTVVKMTKHTKTSPSELNPMSKRFTS